MADFRRPYDMAQDPYFHSAVSDLAKLFAPPSAQDTFYGAKAQETQQKTRGLKALYDAATNPTFNQNRFDRIGMAAGQWTPTQGYYAVDTANQTSRFNNAVDNETSRFNNTADNARALTQTQLEQRGANFRTLNEPEAVAKAAALNAETGRLGWLFDNARAPGAAPAQIDLPAIAAGVYKPDQSFYSVDQGNAVDLANNRADNETSRANNAADNGTKLGVAQLNAVAQPLSPGQVLNLPPTLAGMYGVPAEQRGAINAGQGDTVYLPDGSALSGTPKPLTKSEVEGGILASLPPEMQHALLGSDINVEQIVTPDGPRFVPRSAAINQEPYSKPTAGAQPKTANYQTPDGRTGSARLSDLGVWLDSQTGEALPQGSATFNLQAQGTPGDLGIQPTVANQTEANRTEGRLMVMKNLVDQYRALLQNNPGIIGIPGTVRGTAQDLVSVIGEFSQAFGDLEPNAQVTEDMVTSVARQIAPNRDPAIQQARLLASDLAYKYAQAQNPSGEVSRQAFERALETLTGGMLRNNQSALEALDGVDAMISREAAGVGVLRNPGAAPLPTGQAPASPPVEKWGYVNGKLQRIQ